MRTDLIERATLGRQTYGIAVAGGSFGGPRGIWLECRACPESQVIRGSRFEDSTFADLTDEEAAEVFKRHGWQGEGPRLVKARCPRCASLDSASL